MPMYQYHCTCGEEFVRLRKAADRDKPIEFTDDFPACPGCGATEPDNFRRIECHSNAATFKGNWPGKGNW